MGRRRKPRKVIPHKKVQGYDSMFESILHAELLQNWMYHRDAHGNPIGVDYMMEHRYFPDFIREIGGITYYVEAKGRLWTSAEAAKYVSIKKHLKENERLVFLFANPHLPLPGAKKRKDGTKRTHMEWANSNEIEWYTAESFPRRLR
jgi:hypothetical protein